MNSVCSFRCAGIAALLGLVPCAGQAQLLDRVTVTPYIGWYTPVSALGSAGTAVGAGSLVRKLEQQPDLALGANASYWLTRRVALEIGGMYAASDAKLTTLTPGSGTAFVRDGHVLAGSFKIMAHLLPEESPVNVRLGVGPAVISRAGPAYRVKDGKFTGLTDFGGAVSACTRIPISERVRIRLRAESYLYRSHIEFRSANAPTESYALGRRFQNDFVLSTGLQMFLGR